MSKDKILIVEDELDILSLLKIYFTQQGYEVFTATKGMEGLKLCVEKQPQIVLLDVGLPEGAHAGFEIGRRLRKIPRTRHVPIVFLTALSERSNRLTGLGEVRAQYYIVKPFDLVEVHTIVQNILLEVRKKNQFHPLTGLPVASIIDEYLETLVGKQGWALATIHINSFDAFQSLYGSIAAETVLTSTANLLNNAINELGTPDDFVGQKSVSPGFIVTSTQEKIRLICEHLISNFSDMIRPHFNFRDWKRAFTEVQEGGKTRRVPLLSLSIGILSPEWEAFPNLKVLQLAIKETENLAVAETLEQGGKSVVYERRRDAGSAPDELNSAEELNFISAIEAISGQSEMALLAISLIIDHSDESVAQHQELVKLPSSASRIFPLGALDWALIHPADTIEGAIDQMIDQFEARSFQNSHQSLRISFGWASGPTRNARELIEATARDQIERCYSQRLILNDEPPILNLDLERRPLLRRYKELRLLYAIRQAQVESTGDTSELQIYAHIDRLVAILDHDLKNSLNALRSAIEHIPAAESPDLEATRSELERTTLLCRLWQRSMVESGSGKQMRLETIDIVPWVQQNVRLLVGHIHFRTALELESQSETLRTTLDPQTLMIACLHTLLAVAAAGAKRLRVVVGSLNTIGKPTLVFEDDGIDFEISMPRAEALQEEITLNRWLTLPATCQNLVLAAKVLRRQGVDIHCQQQDGLLRMIWTFPTETQVLPISRAELPDWRSPKPLLSDGMGEPLYSTYTVRSLEDMKQAVSRLEREVLRLDTKRDILTQVSDKHLVQMAKNLLKPIVHELLDCLQQLVNWATVIRTIYKDSPPATALIYKLSLYSQLLVRNMVLALEGTSLQSEPINVNSQIAQVIELLNHKIGGREVILNMDSNLPTIRIAQVEIKQVLMNLLKNAIEATAEHGTIMIQTSRRDSAVEIEVRDTGIGIPPEHGINIFELNFSTKTLPKDGLMNSGVGLFAVHSIVVERTGGAIRVASASLDSQGDLKRWSYGFTTGSAPEWAGTGTLFQIDIPVAREDGYDAARSSG